LTVVQECRAVVNVIVESVVTGKTFSAQIVVVEQPFRVNVQICNCVVFESSDASDTGQRA
jgi:hypothetical protein